MKILTVNNEKEEKFLRQRTADFDFSKFTEKEIDELVEKMRKKMIAANGIGLSANQLGLDLRLFVAQISEEPLERDEKSQTDMPSPNKAEFYAIFNPEIIEFSKQTETIEEGCLSVPGIYGLVERPAEITIVGRDENNKKIKIKASSILARVFQHELDHLNGILFIDKASNIHKIE
ncbi:peptide deformylase [Candidatus Wolfebacteria bacterium]|nr:peptide deformylase [Candidatus Wolfebacteria bacterium]